MAENTNTEREATGPAEVWLRSRYGAYRGHFAWRELEEAFNAGRASLSLPAAGQEPVATPMSGEIALIEKALERVGISSLLNHGAASCVFTEGCCGVSQEHILAYTREIALHCAVALGAAPQPAVAAGWVNLPGQLPEPGKPVLLDIGKKFPIRAMWAAKHTVQAADDDTDWGEYDEATETYYAPEGWYEWNQQEETHWAVNDKPLAWCELPAPSTEGEGP